MVHTIQFHQFLFPKSSPFWWHTMVPSPCLCQCNHTVNALWLWLCLEEKQPKLSYDPNRWPDHFDLAIHWTLAFLLSYWLITEDPFLSCLTPDLPIRVYCFEFAYAWTNNNEKMVWFLMKAIFKMSGLRKTYITELACIG